MWHDCWQLEWDKPSCLQAKIVLLNLRQYKLAMKLELKIPTFKLNNENSSVTKQIIKVYDSVWRIRARIYMIWRGELK